MSIRLSVKNMESLLAARGEKRNMRWAHDVCTASRFVHIDVWRFCAKYNYVENTILPLLKRAITELLAQLDSESLEDAEKETIASYVKNDDDRIKNLKENYLQGKPSAFRPDDTLSEPQSQVG